MFRITLSLVVAVLAALGLCAAPAHAQLARTYVSSFGNDANDCNRSTPCRSFQRAHAQTLASGEITVLDPGGYGAVTITKTISIINDGVGEAGVLVSGGLAGITVNAGPSDRVSLRGLTLKGLDPAFGGSNGIRFNSGGSLTIENCVIRNQNGDGIDMTVNTSTSLVISNTLVADNAGNGIYVQPSGTGAVYVVFNRVEVYNNAAHGIGLVGNSLNSLRFDVSVVDSVAAGNGMVGIISYSEQAVITMIVLRSAAVNNGTGVAVGGSVSAGLGISQSLVTGNTKGWQKFNGPGGQAGILISYGDNVWLNHDGDPSPPFTLSKR